MRAAFAVLAALAALVALPARANDSTAELATGGLAYVMMTKTDFSPHSDLAVLILTPTSGE